MGIELSPFAANAIRSDVKMFLDIFGRLPKKAVDILRTYAHEEHELNQVFKNRQKPEVQLSKNDPQT